MQVQKHIGIKIHEYNGNRLPLERDLAVFKLQFVGRHESASDSVNGREVMGKVNILGNVLKGLFLGHYGNETRCLPFPFPVHGNEHLHKTVHRVQQGMQEIEGHTRVLDL